MLQTASSCSVNCYCSIPNREEVRKEEELTELKEWREEFRRVEERRTVEREEGELWSGRSGGRQRGGEIYCQN